MPKKQYARVIADEVWGKDCAPSERLIMLAIAYYQSKDYQPSAEDVAFLTGLVLNTVVRLRKRLVEAGHLKEIVIAR